MTICESRWVEPSCGGSLATTAQPGRNEPRPITSLTPYQLSEPVSSITANTHSNWKAGWFSAPTRPDQLLLFVSTSAAWAQRLLWLWQVGWCHSALLMRRCCQAISANMPQVDPWKKEHSYSLFCSFSADLNSPLLRDGRRVGWLRWLK